MLWRSKPTKTIQDRNYLSLFFLVICLPVSSFILMWPERCMEIDTRGGSMVLTCVCFHHSFHRSTTLCIPCLVYAHLLQSWAKRPNSLVQWSSLHSWAPPLPALHTNSRIWPFSLLPGEPEVAPAVVPTALALTWTVAWSHSATLFLDHFLSPNVSSWCEEPYFLSYPWFLHRPHICTQHVKHINKRMK